MILELFRQCGIFLFFLLDFGTVPTVIFYVFSFGFWNYSDSVMFFVFLLDFGTVPTVIFCVFLLDFGAVPTM